MDTHSDVIALKDIRFTYPSGRSVLEGVDFCLEQGSRAGLIGSNGSGKTSLLFLIMGLLRPFTGEVRLFGENAADEKDFQAHRRNMGFLFQNADDQLFSPTVIEDVAFGPLNLGQDPEQARETARRTLENLGLSGFENRVSYRLSGGEKKLVSLATVLAMDPDVLLLDEPTTGLDEATYERLADILNNLDKTMLIVSHEYDFLTRTVKDIYGMEKGQVFYSGDAAALHTHAHIHPGGRLPHKHAHKKDHDHDHSEDKHGSD